MVLSDRIAYLRGQLGEHASLVWKQTEPTSETPLLV